jgi:hypothetical protein
LLKLRILLIFKISIIFIWKWICFLDPIEKYINKIIKLNSKQIISVSFLTINKYKLAIKVPVDDIQTFQGFGL